MADIFLSYARADQPSAAKIAAALEAGGHSVWWDQHLASGHDFSEDIERELADAKAVLVLWSATSVKSHWVRDEAAFGQRENKLIPASIDGTEPPMGFRQLHTTSVDPDDPAPLVAAASAFLSGEKPRPVAPEATKPAKDKKKMSPWAIAGIVAISVAGATGFLTPDRWDKILGLDDASEVAARDVSLAIMPFVTSGDADIDYLSVGMASSLNSSLASLEGLQLTANSSTSAVAGQGLTATELGTQLGVSHLVEGLVTDTGSNLRIEVSLIDASSARQLWSETYTARPDRIQQTSADIAQELAVALQSRLNVGAGRIVTADDVDPRAYEAYLRAYEAQTKRVDASKRRLAYNEYRRALAIEPDFVDAQAGLAYLLAVSPGTAMGLPPDRITREYFEAQEKIDALDPDHHLGRAAKVFGLYTHETDLSVAEDIATSLLAEVPDYAPGLYALGRVHLVNGAVEPAIDTLASALRRDPFNRTISIAYSDALIQSGSYDRFAEYARQCDGCAYLGFYWFNALMRLGDRADFDRDWPLIRRYLVENGDVEEAQLPALNSYAEATINGQTMTIPPPFRTHEDVIVSSSQGSNRLHLMAYGGEVQMALGQLERWAEDSSVRGRFTLFYPGRSGFDEAARADPRYHAIFDNPQMQATIKTRAENGDTSFRPVFPVKPYEGK